MFNLPHTRLQVAVRFVRRLDAGFVYAGPLSPCESRTGLRPVERGSPGAGWLCRDVFTPAVPSFPPSRRCRRQPARTVRSHPRPGRAVGARSELDGRSVRSFAPLDLRRPGDGGRRRVRSPRGAARRLGLGAALAVVLARDRFGALRRMRERRWRPAAPARAARRAASVAFASVTPLGGLLYLGSRVLGVPRIPSGWGAPLGLSARGHSCASPARTCCRNCNSTRTIGSSCHWPCWRAWQSESASRNSAIPNTGKGIERRVGSHPARARAVRPAAGTRNFWRVGGSGLRKRNDTIAKQVIYENRERDSHLRPAPWFL